MGEEDSKDLQGDEGKVLREKVFSLTNGVLGDNEKLSEKEVSCVVYYIKRERIVYSLSHRSWMLLIVATMLVDPRDVIGP